jgi:hypothetical protein
MRNALYTIGNVGLPGQNDPLPIQAVRSVRGIDKGYLDRPTVRPCIFDPGIQPRLTALQCFCA